MTYTVAPDDQGEHVHVIHSGPAAPAEIVAARAEAVRLLKAMRWRRFLIDLRQVQNTFSTMDHFNIISSTVADTEMVQTSIAVVVDVRDFGDFRFAEDLAFNRGLGLKIFTDAAAAAAWLAGQ